MVVKGPGNVPYDIEVTPKTRIRSGNESLHLKDLSQYQNKTVTLKFVPERRGDVAESIKLGS